MPYSRRRAPMRRSRGTRRRMNWVESHGNVVFAANNNWTTVDLFAPYRAITGATTAGLTILRTHLWVLPHAPAAGDLFWVGLSVLDTDDIVAPGANAQVPNPRDNPYVDWAFFQRYEFDVNLRVPSSNTDFAGAYLDLKSRRRCHDLQQTWTLTVLQETVGTAAKTYDFASRTLVALP